MEKGHGYEIIWEGEEPTRNLSEADAVYALCFDGTAFWKEVWRSIILPLSSNNRLVARVPNAGTSGRPDEYVEYCNVSSVSGNALIPVITHSKCGFWGTTPVKIIHDHGIGIARALNDNKRISFAAHLELSEAHGIIPHVYDPLGLERTHAEAEIVISSIRQLEGKFALPGQLDKLEKLRLVIVRKGIFGPPPLANILPLSPDFQGQLYRSLDIAHALNGRRKVAYECAQQFIGE